MMSYDHDLFCSFEPANSELVIKISDALVNISKQKVWIDKNKSSSLNASIQDAITRSEIVLAFITKKYFESKNCQLEISFANRINKKVLYVMLEKLDPKKLPFGIGENISTKLCLSGYEESSIKDLYKKLIGVIYDLKNERQL